MYNKPLLYTFCDVSQWHLGGSLSKKEEFDFETALNELNKLVEKIEKGGIALEESLKNFERGITLVRQCQQALQSAEQKVMMLTQKNGQPTLEPYHDEDESDL